MSVKTLGRCPDCGKTATVMVVPGRPIEVFEHGCLARACEVTGCLVARLPAHMVQFPGGAWYCPSHGLLTVLRELLILHRSRNGHDIMAALFEETVPSVLALFPR